MKLSEVVQKVMELAGTVRDSYEVALRKDHPRYPIILPDEPETPPPPEEKEFRKLLESLDPAMVYQLILIAHLGRWEFGTDDLPGAYRKLKQLFTPQEMAVTHLMANYALAEDLEDGLEKLQEAKIDLDSLPRTVAKKASPRKP